MPEYSGVVVESQVDWLTASAHGEDKAANLLALARHYQEEEKAKGNRTINWRLMGYEGTHCGAVEWGQRDRASTLVRLIGQRASNGLADVLSLADQVTRLDIAVTWRAEPPDPFIGRNAYALAEAFKRLHPKTALPSLIQDAAGGTTCYVGSRESENFLRIYNKGAEALQKGDEAEAERYHSCWRYELETKGTVSKPLADIVDSLTDPTSYIQSYLYTYCQAHGIEPAFPHEGAVGLVPGFRRRADADTKLAHLKRNVRPTVRFLREQGREDDLREALEFDRGAALLRELQRLLDSDPGRVGMPPKRRG